MQNVPPRQRDRLGRPKWPGAGRVGVRKYIIGRTIQAASRTERGIGAAERGNSETATNAFRPFIFKSLTKPGPGWAQLRSGLPCSRAERLRSEGQHQQSAQSDASFSLPSQSRASKRNNIDLLCDGVNQLGGVFPGSAKLAWRTR